MTTSLTTATALHELGVTESTLTTDEKRFLDDEGYVPLYGILSSSELDAIRARLAELLAAEKENAGKEAHQEAGADRLANLVDKGDVFRKFFTCPRVLAGVAHVLRWDMKLSSLNSRAALPGQGLQAMHTDFGEAVEPGDFQVCNSIWLLDDFTMENGATRVVPKSHLTGKGPGDSMADLLAPHPEEKLLISPAGTVVVFNSHTWHGGTRNQTAKPRRAIHSYWTRRDRPQQTNQRKFLSPQTRAAFSAPIRHLLDVQD